MTTCKWCGALGALFTQTLIAQVTQFFCFTLVKCSRAAHYHGLGTEAALSALPPRRGSELAEHPVPAALVACQKGASKRSRHAALTSPTGSKTGSGILVGRTICVGSSWVGHSADGQSSDRIRGASTFILLRSTTGRHQKLSTGLMGCQLKLAITGYHFDVALD